MEYTLAEWQLKGVKRFGGNLENWKHKCPACGRINAGSEYKESNAGLKQMYTACVGYYNGKGVKPINGESPKHGCTWATHGLIMPFRDSVTVIDGTGIETAVFDLA
jgi:hypothetical protein